MGTLTEGFSRLETPYTAKHLLDVKLTWEKPGMEVFKLATYYRPRTLETIYQELPFETVTQNDPTLAVGTTQVIQVGKVGQKAITTLVTVFDDQERRQVIAEETVAEPLNEIIAIGTKQPEVTPSEPDTPVVPDTPTVPDTSPVPDTTDQQAPTNNLGNSNDTAEDNNADTSKTDTQVDDKQNSADIQPNKQQEPAQTTNLSQQVTPTPDTVQATKLPQTTQTKATADLPATGEKSHNFLFVSLAAIFSALGAFLPKRKKS